MRGPLGASRSRPYPLASVFVPDSLSIRLQEPSAILPSSQLKLIFVLRVRSGLTRRKWLGTLIAAANYDSKFPLLRLFRRKGSGISVEALYSD